MPLFGSQKRPVKKPNNAVAVGAAPLPPPPPSESAHSSPRPQPVIPPRRELMFHCQLAHGSATKEIKDFSNVKLLYAKIAEAYSISTDEIIFCTLNTHKVDMSRLLGGQIGLEDFIFAHIRGRSKDVIVNKTESALGLTITDNGAGYAFIKRIKDGSTVSQLPGVSIGDLIESINGKCLVGCRHYEVAKLLKELPRFTEISMKLVEPRKAFEAIAPRGAVSKAVAGPMIPPLLGEEGGDARLEQAVAKGDGRATLRLKKDGQAVVEQVKAWEVHAADKVDDLLESFMGIRDTELAQTMVDLSRGTGTVDEFALAMDEQLGEFEFPDEFVIDVWSMVEQCRATSSQPHLQ